MSSDFDVMVVKGSDGFVKLQIHTDVSGELKVVFNSEEKAQIAARNMLEAAFELFRAVQHLEHEEE
tara:strand:- start:447 stop:644 length:198 start_codon:yes stop_codon:yes gene_type:complete